ncbi:MAG: site-specific integrase [Chlorobi bacterium]|nr:site-specific integrase [Chlorobiota bacterium]
MQILSDKEINKICKQVVNTSELNDIFLHSLFDTLYKTGLRVGEVTDWSQWTIVSKKYLQVQTLKGSNPRTFKNKKLNQIYVDLIRYNTTYLAQFNYKNLSRAFNRFAPYSQLLIGNKQVSTHLFRHNKAKKLKAKGYTDIEIQTYLGEKDLKNALVYINSKIYVL